MGRDVQSLMEEGADRLRGPVLAIVPDLFKAVHCLSMGGQLRE